MKILKSILTLTFLTASPQLFCAELLCKGRGWIEVGEGFESTALFKFDSKSLEASLELWKGSAQGKISAGEKIYTGMLTFPSGEQAWINLDRYTGELSVAPPRAGDPKKPVMFLGTCERAQAKF